MGKTLSDEFKDWWRDEGKAHDSAYEGRVRIAEQAFLAGADTIIERFRDGKPLPTRKMGRMKR